MNITRAHFNDGRNRPYSESATYGGVIYLCGQIPQAPDGTTPIGIQNQVAQVMRNLEKALNVADSDLSSILKLTVYIADFDYFEEYNSAYIDALQGHPLPPRTTIQVARFRGEKLIEIDAVAAISASSDSFERSDIDDHATL